tara:strand:- start:4 stop:306 length:303 start_codon:yes stop_codon:yes gene_type:complete
MTTETKTPPTPGYADMVGRLVEHRAECERKAWDNLARYKFSQFGYWSAKWVTANQIIGDRQPNPFRELVDTAKDVVRYRDENTQACAHWPECGHKNEHNT